MPAILAAQGEDGHWEGRDRFYTAKYRGTVWQLLILAELGADGADERVRRGCEAVLRDAQDRLSGGFATSRAARAAAALHSRVIPCLTGNMVFSLIRLGLLDDPRVQPPSTGSRPTSASTTATATRADRLALRRLRDVLGPPHLPHGRGQGAQGAGRDPAASGARRRCGARLTHGVEYLLRTTSTAQPRPDARRPSPAGSASASRSCTRPTCSRSSASSHARAGAGRRARAAPKPARPSSPSQRADAAGRWRLQQHLQRPLRRRHRDQGRAQPLGHAPSAAGPQSVGSVRQQRTCAARAPQARAGHDDSFGSRRSSRRGRGRQARPARLAAGPAPDDRGPSSDRPDPPLPPSSSVSGRTASNVSNGSALISATSVKS